MESIAISPVNPGTIFAGTGDTASFTAGNLGFGIVRSTDSGEHWQVLAADAFRAGASGYLLKTSPGEELVEAVRQVAQGRAYLTSLIAKDLITVLLDAKKEPTGEKLTGRQREVLQLIAEGRTMKEVASLLHISPRTAESHKYEIMEVLGAQNTAELVQHAIRMKLVSV